MNFSSFIVTAGLAFQANPVATNQHVLDNLPVRQGIPNVPQRPSEIHKAIRRRIDHLPKPNHQGIRVLVEKIEEEHGDTVAKDYSFMVYQILYRGGHKNQDTLEITIIHE